MGNKKLLYKENHERLTIEVFKLLDVDELVDDTYEIVGTNPTTGESDNVTTNTPQGAKALFDNVITALNSRLG